MANSNDKIKELSIQARAKEEAATGAGIWWFGRQDNENIIAPWWSEDRDRNLRDFWMLEGNDILQGAISSLLKKFKAMNWLLEGPQTRVKERQEILISADFGAGWGNLLGKVLTDYLTQDKGGFIELIGEGRPDGPMKGLPLGMAHLDAQFCQLTGDVSFPVIFHSTSTGQSHKLHATRVAHVVDMPSPNEDMNGIGFCGTSRVIASSQVLLKLAQYKNEKLSDLPQSGLLLLNNITQQKWDDVTAEHERGRRKLGQELWQNIITLLGFDPAQPITADFISFANLPDNILALSFGVDPREFWPITEGRLGSGAETTIQHQKAKGKLVGEVTSMIERVVNWQVLPPNTHFTFDFQDDEEDKLRSEINDATTETIMRMYQGDEINPPPATRLEIRQMLADNTDYFLEDFLQVDITEEEELTDTEREAKAYFGKPICLDRYGKQYQRGIKWKEQNTSLLEMAEENYRQGLIDIETLLDYRLGMVIDES
jgi:hypothetical protein